MDPIVLYRRAADGALAVLRHVRPDQLSNPSICTMWSVQELIDHLTGSTEYLLASLAGRPAEPVSGTGAADFERGSTAALAGLAQPGALEQLCPSPLGFDWPLSQAVLGTMMDTLIHTWDLATSIGRPVVLDAELVQICIDAFLPDMADHGRAAGLIGPAVTVDAEAPPTARLLAALGRQP